MADYILYVLVAIIVFGHLFSIFNMMLGNYTSIFVRFFSVVSVKSVFCKTFLHNIAKKKYTPLRLKFFSDYCGFDRAFLSR